MEGAIQRAFYPQGWKRNGYAIPPCAADLASSFESRWRRIFKTLLRVAVVLIVIFHGLGVIVSLAGGLVAIRQYNASVSGVFSRFEVLPPTYVTGGFSKYMQERADEATFGKMVRMLLGGLLFLTYACSEIFVQPDAGFVGNVLGWLGMFGGVAGLVNAAYLAMIKLSAAKRRGDTA